MLTFVLFIGVCISIFYNIKFAVVAKKKLFLLRISYYLLVLCLKSYFNKGQL